ncbi:hypothetical protein MMC13_005451 [Lambiella insularis]|nr:hypothetical protein [Lambiella insularis]
MDDQGLSDEVKNYPSFWFNLLRNCLVGSPIAHYIEHLRIGTSQPPEHGYLIDHKWDQHVDGMELIRCRASIGRQLSATFSPSKAGMSSAEYYEPFSKDLVSSMSIFLSECWDEGFELTNDEAEPEFIDEVRAQLLPLLTNLHTLELRLGNDTQNAELLLLVDQIIMGTGLPDCNTFCNLATVVLDFACIIAYSEPFEIVQSFMALPSIRHVAVCGMRQKAYRRLRNAPNSRATDLAFADTDMEPDILPQLLVDGAPLERLALNGRCARTIGDACMSQALLANAKETLIHLELVGSSANASGNYIPLQDFTNLRTVIISDIYLDFPGQPLYALFPGTLTLLGINSQRKQRSLTKGLLALLEHKRKSLPNLVELRVRTDWVPAEKLALRTASKAVGVKLVALKYSRHDFEALLQT